MTRHEVWVVWYHMEDYKEAILTNNLHKRPQSFIAHWGVAWWSLAPPQRSTWSQKSQKGLEHDHTDSSPRRPRAQSSVRRSLVNLLVEISSTTSNHCAWNCLSSWFHYLTTRQSHQSRGREAPQSRAGEQADHPSPRGSRRVAGVGPRSSYLRQIYV